MWRLINEEKCPTIPTVEHFFCRLSLVAGNSRSGSVTRFDCVGVWIKNLVEEYRRFDPGTGGDEDRHFIAARCRCSCCTTEEAARCIPALGASLESFYTSGAGFFSQVGHR